MMEILNGPCVHHNPDCYARQVLSLLFLSSLGSSKFVLNLRTFSIIDGSSHYYLISGPGVRLLFRVELPDYPS